MGQEESRLVSDDDLPVALTERTLSSVADYIKSGKAQRILVMTGAGISTAAGIPDFRSPGTGLYANLARLNLPHAEAVFDISYFRQNPNPFYVLAQELYPGKFHPTVSHAFIALLADKGLLQMLFTQNIDCLERRAGVPGDKVVEAHGSFATQRCIDCKEEYPDVEMREHIEKAQVPRCKTCNGLVKPDIVFFGEALPKAFSNNSYQTSITDLVLIIGTSLSVYPFASLPEMVPLDRPRVLFNMERVGDIGSRSDDVLVLGECDKGIRKLADALGWREELEDLWEGIVGPKEVARQRAASEKHDGEIEDEVAKLAAGVETTLKLDQHSETETTNAYTAEVITQDAGTKEKLPEDIEAEVASTLDNTEKAPDRSQDVSSDPDGESDNTLSVDEAVGKGDESTNTEAKPKSTTENENEKSVL